MLNYVFIGIIIFGAILETICHFQKEGSKSKKVIGILLIAVGVIGALVNFQINREQEKASALEGALLPRKVFRYGNSLFVRMAGIISATTINDIGNNIGKVKVPIKQLGKCLEIEISDNGPVLSATIRDSSNKVIANIENNYWTINPNNFFRRKYDQYGLEVIDNFNVVVLQLYAIDFNELRINGVFFTDNECIVINDSGIYNLIRETAPRELLTRDELKIKRIFAYDREGVGERSKYGIAQLNKYFDNINMVEELREKLYFMSDKEIKISLHSLINDLEGLKSQFIEAEESLSNETGLKKLDELMNNYKSTFRDYAYFIDKDINRRIQLKNIPKEKLPNLEIPDVYLYVNNSLVLELIVKYFREIDSLL